MDTIGSANLRWWFISHECQPDFGHGRYMQASRLSDDDQREMTHGLAAAQVEGVDIAYMGQRVTR